MGGANSLVSETDTRLPIYPYQKARNSRKFQENEFVPNEPAHNSQLSVSRLISTPQPQTSVFGVSVLIFRTQISEAPPFLNLDPQLRELHAVSQPQFRTLGNSSQFLILSSQAQESPSPLLVRDLEPPTSMLQADFSVSAVHADPILQVGLGC